jgi:hypothetical protein
MIAVVSAGVIVAINTCVSSGLSDKVFLSSVITGVTGGSQPANRRIAESIKIENRFFFIP